MILLHIMKRSWVNGVSWPFPTTFLHCWWGWIFDRFFLPAEVEGGDQENSLVLVYVLTPKHNDVPIFKRDFFG